jgi:hypothetical protein
VAYIYALYVVFIFVPFHNVIEMLCVFVFLLAHMTIDGVRQWLGTAQKKLTLWWN